MILFKLNRRIIDISPANIAFTCNAALSSDEDLFEAMSGQPVTAMYESKELPQPPHLPKQLVKSADWGVWYDTYEEDIRLIDWGVAFPADKTLQSIAQPNDLKSPETFFVGSFDYRHDLWRAGCVVGAFSLLISCLPNGTSFPYTDHTHPPDGFPLYNRLTPCITRPKSSNSAGILMTPLSGE
jgi:hypothetical protein